MTQLAREELFSTDEIACVHVMNRAVRRCFLMGDDPLSGKNFDHRNATSGGKRRSSFQPPTSASMIGLAWLPNISPQSSVK